MPLDTNIALQAKLPQIDGPLDTYAKGANLQSLMNQGRMQDLQMKGLMSQQQEDADTKTAYASSADPATRLQALMKVSPKAYQGEAKFQNEQQKMQMDNAKTQAEIQKMHLDFTNQAARDLASNPSDENIKAWADLAVRNGVMDMNHATALINHVSGLPPLERSQVFAGMGANAEQKLKQFTPDLKPVNLGGATKFVDQNSMTNPGLGEQSFAHTATPDAILSSNTSRENSIRTDNRMRDPSVKLTHGVQGLTPEQNDALFGENGAVTTGRLDPNRINSRTASLFADAVLKNPATDFSKISGDIALGRNATFRQKAMVAEALPEIMTNMVDAGKKIGFSDNRTIGKMQGWVKGEFNDPDMTEYMTQRNDALMTIAGVMRGTGMTDQAHKAEIEVSSPTMSPQALDAWMRGQMKSLQPRLDINRRITKDVPHSSSTPANKSGPQAIKSDADYNSLPSGAEFIAPDGSHRRKP